jgi:hypothetical protein
MERFMKYAVEMASCVMIHMPSFMKIGMGVRAILRGFLRDLRGCNVGITDGRDLRIKSMLHVLWLRNMISFFTKTTFQENNRYEEDERSGKFKILIPTNFLVFWKFESRSKCSRHVPGF